MRQKLWLTLFAIYAASLLTACPSRELGVTVCIFDSANSGAWCTRPDDSQIFLTSAELDNHVVLAPKDAERLLKACREGLQ